MKTLSLFAGVGGIDLGLETLGWDVAAFSEFDPKIAKKKGRQYAAEVFQRRFPAAVPLGNISDLVFARNRENVPGILRKAAEDGAQMGLLYKGDVDIISGGFPCQDISHAGKGAGIKEGTRSGLWFRYAEAIEGLKPRGVLIENVAALASKGLDQVLIDLARIGYDCEWDIVPAAAVGAPHLRERMFILAWPHGTATHGPWPAPPIFDNWLLEPAGVPRITAEKVEERTARLRCLGNAVVPQCAAWVGSILEARLRTGELDMTVDPSTWDARDRSKNAKLIGWAGPVEHVMDESIAGMKLPRAGRMTAGWVYERNRAVTKTEAKRRALTYMAPTLRRYEGDHPGLPDLVPTPNAWVSQDGEGPETWLARREELKAKGINGNGAGMPLTIYAQLKQSDRMTPTPTAKDADSSRSRTAIRETPPARESQMGETLTDFVDPTNRGRLLPTPTSAKGGACDGSGRQGSGNLEGAVRDMEGAQMLPTPRVYDAEHRGNGLTPAERAGTTGACLSSVVQEMGKEDVLLPTPKATDGDKGVRSYEGAVTEMARGRGGDLHAAVLEREPPTILDGDQLLPTPTSSEDKYRIGGDSQQSKSLGGLAARGDLEPGLPKGQLAPDWVDWDMGFPVGWTDLTVEL